MCKGRCAEVKLELELLLPLSEKCQDSFRLLFVWLIARVTGSGGVGADNVGHVTNNFATNVSSSAVKEFEGRQIL